MGDLSGLTLLLREIVAMLPEGRDRVALETGPLDKEGLVDRADLEDKEEGVEEEDLEATLQ